jgi:Flp pilus assembly protein TadD
MARALIIIIILVFGGWLAYQKHESGAPARANNEAVELLNSGNPTGAIAVLDQAINRHSGNAMLYFNRGVAFHELRRFPEAVTDLRRAMELDATLTTRAEDLIRESQELMPPG